MRWPKLLLAVAVASAAALAQAPDYSHVGRTPTEEEIRKLDIAIDPTGAGLPAGAGTAVEGAKVFAQKCAACHGPTGVEGPASRLVGGEGTIGTAHPVKTPGSFYAFATTIWDYINRAMPRTAPGSLTPNEVYSLTAFVLFRNGIIRENDVLDAKSLPKVQMPNRGGFTPVPPGWQPGAKRPFGFYPGAGGNSATAK